MLKLNVIKYRRLWLFISGFLISASIILLLTLGLKPGLDFIGGSLLEIKYSDKSPTTSLVYETLGDLELGSLIVQPTDDSVVIRFSNTDEASYLQTIAALSGLTEELGEMEELKFEAIGPSIGQELRSKSFWLFIFVILIIIIYIALAFQKVSKPVSSWKYGLVATITLFHDLIIVLGVFVILGYLYGTEINTPFIVALLMVLGYSVNDTIVVFDRIREYLPRSEDSFEGTVNNSVNQTLARSINTTLTTLFALLAVFFFGGDTIADFVLVLIVGVFCGAYSSIFLASPLLTLFKKKVKIS
jgi:preprotein translocase subunit SecF